MEALSIKRLEDEKFAIVESLRGVTAGDMILIEQQGRISLMKYESINLPEKESRSYSFGRHVSVIAFSEEEFDYIRTGNKPKPKAASEVEQTKLQLDVYGTHLLQFEEDEEFGIYLPQSESFTPDIFLKLASLMCDGSIVRYDEPILITDMGAIKERMKTVVRPEYYESVIIPFLENRPTKFALPRMKINLAEWLSNRKGRFFWKNYREVVTKLSFGDFLYVGGRGEVYCLGIPKENGGLYKQGTYSTSTKPILMFSNNYLNFVACHEKDHKVPSFKGHPFIFPHIGRRQNCKNALFHGRYDVVTGDIHEALEHFKTTDFKEFSDVIKKYHDTIRTVHPSTKLIRNGKYFY